MTTTISAGLNTALTLISYLVTPKGIVMIQRVFRARASSD